MIILRFSRNKKERKTFNIFVLLLLCILIKSVSKPSYVRRLKFYIRPQGSPSNCRSPYVLIHFTSFVPFTVFPNHHRLESDITFLDEDLRFPSGTSSSVYRTNVIFHSFARARLKHCFRKYRNQI